MIFIGESAPNSLPVSQINSLPASQVNSFRTQHWSPLVPHAAPKQEICYHHFGNSDDSYEDIDKISPLNSRSMKRNSMGVEVIQGLETTLLADPDPIFQRYRKPMPHQIVPDNTAMNDTILDVEEYSVSMLDDDFGNYVLDVGASLEVSNDDNSWKRNDYSLDNLADSAKTVVAESDDSTKSSFMSRSDKMASSIQTLPTVSSHDDRFSMLISRLSIHSDTSKQQRKPKPRTRSISSGSTHSSNSRSIDTRCPDNIGKSPTLLRTSHSTSCFPFLEGIFSNRRKDSSTRSTVESQPHRISQKSQKFHSTANDYARYGQFL